MAIAAPSPPCPAPCPPRLLSEEWSVTSGQQQPWKKDTYPQGFWTKESLACLSGRSVASSCPASGSAGEGRHQGLPGACTAKGRVYFKHAYSPLTAGESELPVLLGQLLK